MIPTESQIIETLGTFEFLPRTATGRATIERHFHPPLGSLAFRILFPDVLGLTGSILFVTNLHPTTGNPFVPYGRVDFEAPRIEFNRRVPYGTHWRKELREAIGVYVALAREKPKPRPNPSDLPDDVTWQQAVGDVDAANHAKRITARHRWAAYEKEQSGSAHYGTEHGCFVSGAAGVARWLEECGK